MVPYTVLHLIRQVQPLSVLLQNIYCPYALLTMAEPVMRYPAGLPKGPGQDIAQQILPQAQGINGIYYK